MTDLPNGLHEKVIICNRYVNDDMYISKSRLDVMFAKKNPLDNGYLSTDGGKRDQT